MMYVESAHVRHVNEVASSRVYYQYETIAELTDYFNSLDGEESEHGVHTLHLFAPGYYGRVMTIPKDSAFTGIKHGIRNHLSLISGSVVFTNGYDEFQQYDAPFSMTTYPGAQRAGYALMDSVFMTVHQIDIDQNKNILKQLEAK